MVQFNVTYHAFSLGYIYNLLGRMIGFTGYEHKIPLASV